MSSEWITIKLGDVLQVDNAKLGGHVEPAVFSLSKYDGVVLAEDYFDKRVASAQLAGYKTLEPGEWAYSTIHIDEGSIARNNLGLVGVLSPMYTTMRWAGGDDHDPRYFELLLRSPQLLATYRDNAQGSVNRRRSLPFKKFASLRVTVPHATEQRRIVSLLAALDDDIAACRTVCARAQELIDALLEDHRPASEQARLDDFAALRSGPSWKAAQEALTPSDDRVPVIGITNTPNRASMTVDERRYVAGLPESVPVLSDDSLVMIRTNGNRQRIGNIYRTIPQAVGSTVSAFQIAIEPTDPADSDYLYWFLRAPSTQRAISESASGSTGLGNVAVKWLRQLEVPWPTAKDRANHVALLNAADASQSAAGDQVHRLIEVRAALLDELLDGRHEIPDAYDRLLEDAS